MAASNAAAALKRIASQALAARSVHVKMHPRPGNLTESTEILRVLERYGEIEMFRNLKVSLIAMALFIQ